MKSGKLIQKFFEEKGAKKAQSYQRSKTSKGGLVILKVEIVDAYQLFKRNDWLKENPFKKIGKPHPGQFIVIVHYINNVQAVTKSIPVKKQIVKASKLRDAANRFRVVKLNAVQKEFANKVLFPFVSDTTVPTFRFRYFRTATSGTISKKVLFEPMSYKYTAAA